MKRKLLDTAGSSWLLLFAMMLLGFFVFRFSVSAKELKNYEYGNRQAMIEQEIPKEYHFSAQIQRTANGERETEFVPFGIWDNEEKEQAEISGEFVITRITGDGKKGTIGAWYYNVGTYQGMEVDLKCTITDYMQKAGPNDTAGANLGWIALSAENLGIYVRHLRWVELQMEFYDAKSGNPLSLHSTAVLTDIDEGEGVMLLSGDENYLTSKDCKLQSMALSEDQAYKMQKKDKQLLEMQRQDEQIEDNYVILYETEQASAEDEAKDSWAQVQVHFQGSQFRYRMYSRMGMERLLENDLPEGTMKTTASDEATEEGAMQMRTGSEAGERIEDGEAGGDGLEAPEFMLHFQGYSDCRLTPLTTGDGTLTVQDSDECKKEKVLLYHREEDFVYEMSYKVSPEYKNWYYDTFTVCAQLPKEIKFFSGEVYTEDGKRVSDQFFIRELDGLVYFEAKRVKQDSFYGKTYEFAINGNIKHDAPLEPVWDGTRYTLPLAMQVRIERNGKIEEKQTNEVWITVVEEYVEGRAAVVLKDILSGVVLTDGEVALLEWDNEQQTYKEVKRTRYEKETGGYMFDGLTKNHKNQGKYKVSISQLPEHYLGLWEQELEVKTNQAVFEVTGKHQPTGETLIRMTSKIIRMEEGKEHISEEYDSSDNAVIVRAGDKIQYHVYVERDCALTYKSGELLIKNKIPEGLLYDKTTLNLIGEIQHPVENSTAKIASVLLNKEGELVWKVNHLDGGEIAHMIFEVTVPKEDWKEDGKKYEDYAKLMDGDKMIASNVLEHQVKVSLEDTAPVIKPEEVLPDSIKPEEVLPDSGKDSETGVLKNQVPGSQQETVKTGDSSKRGIYLLMAAGAAAVLSTGCFITIKQKQR